jgi:hypothetical protein
VRRRSELRGGACRSTAVALVESVEMAAPEAAVEGEVQTRDG